MPDLSESRGALLAAACRTINAAQSAPAAPVTRLRPRCIHMELLACCDAFIGSCVASPPHQPVVSTPLTCISSSNPACLRNPSRVTLWNAVVERHLLARRANFNAALDLLWGPALLHAALAISGFSPLLPAPFASRVSEIDNALPWQLCSFGFNVLGMCLFMRRWQTQATRLCCQRYRICVSCMTACPKSTTPIHGSCVLSDSMCYRPNSSFF